MFELFLKLHFFLALLAVLALLKHVLPFSHQAWIFPVASLGLWGLNTFLRLSRIAYYNLGGRPPNRVGQASVTHFLRSQEEDVVSAIVVTVRLRRPLSIRPGQYVYLFFSDMGIRRRLQAHPYSIAWWDDSLNAMNLSFLIQPQSGISSELIARNSIRKVIIDGPYGKDLKLDDCETVILIAKGIGISGIISYARHMTYRRVSKDKDHEAYRRGLITRKLDVFWVMEDNCQQDWASEWIQNLQSKDAEKVTTITETFRD